MSNDLAYVYLATRGGQVELLYLMNIQDAKKICSHNQTKGMGRGGEWALFWTSKANFENNADTKGTKWRKDDGRFNDLFEELNINILNKG